MLRISAARRSISVALVHPKKMDVDFTGDEAITAAAALLLRINAAGARPMMSRGRRPSRETSIQESCPVAQWTCDREAREREAVQHAHAQPVAEESSDAGRLALEMAAREASERRALEGELHILEAAWKEAEEIAGIADDMFLPASVVDDLARLKKKL